LTGINVIIYYAPSIFESARLASDIALSQTVVLGFTNLIFTVLAMTMIDKFGRKTLLIIGSVGMTVFLSLVSRAFFLESFSGYTVLISLVGFLAFFAFSQGAVIWVFLSEIFPNRMRAKGQALGSFTHWVGAATITWLFPVITKSLGSGPTFLFFSFMMILQLIFVVKILPETKGKSLEQIQKEIGIE
jgi:MFS family permease